MDEKLESIESELRAIRITLENIGRNIDMLAGILNENLQAIRQNMPPG